MNVLPMLDALGAMEVALLQMVVALFHLILVLALITRIAILV